MAHEKERELLERAANLVGNPGTNISGSTDIACIEWQKDYADFLSTLPEEKEEKSMVQLVENVACDFAEYLYSNRWFTLDDNGKWHYCFEHGTAITNENYTKNYIKTTKQLFVKYVVQSKINSLNH